VLSFLFISLLTTGVAPQDFKKVGNWLWLSPQCGRNSVCVCRACQPGLPAALKWTPERMWRVLVGDVCRLSPLITPRSPRLGSGAVSGAFTNSLLRAGRPHYTQGQQADVGKEFAL
jgi:hypothetical protein